jgi:hypothetical protein
MIAPKISENFFSTITKHKRPSFGCHFILFIIIFAFIKQRLFGSVNISFPTRDATINEHDFFIRKNGLTSIVDPFLTFVIKRDSTTVRRTNITKVSNIPPRLKPSVVVNHLPLFCESFFLIRWTRITFCGTTLRI